MNCDETKEAYAHILQTVVFRQAEWLVGDNPLCLKFWGKLTPFLQKRQFSISIRS